MFIYIVGETNDGQPRQMGGFSGLSYVFNWNAEFGRYVCRVDSQTAVDDVLTVNWACPSFPWRFGVVFEEMTPAVPGRPPRPVIPPYISPKLYAAYPIEDLLGLAADCGITVQGDRASPDNIKRQIDAYCIGRAWSGKELKDLRDEVKQLKASAPAAVTVVPPPAPEVPVVTLTPAATQTTVPLKRRPGRKPKIDVRKLAVA